MNPGRTVSIAEDQGLQFPQQLNSLLESDDFPVNLLIDC